VALSDEVEAAATAAAAFAGPGEAVAGVIAAEPEEGVRRYLVAYGPDERRRWLVLDADGAPVRELQAVRAAASIAALVEIAEETAAGGDLDELRAQLVALRLTENPDGIDAGSPFAEAMQRAGDSVQAFVADVEAGYKVELS
jgi:hypothetical protein